MIHDPFLNLQRTEVPEVSDYLPSSPWLPLSRSGHNKVYRLVLCFRLRKVSLITTDLSEESSRLVTRLITLYFFINGLSLAFPHLFINHFDPNHTKKYQQRIPRRTTPTILYSNGPSSSDLDNCHRSSVIEHSSTFVNVLKFASSL